MFLVQIGASSLMKNIRTIPEGFGVDSEVWIDRRS